MIRPWQSFLYGCLELPLSGIEVLLRLYLIVYFTEFVGLSLELCLMALALSIFWGLLFEPWIGHRSDEFVQGGQSRWPWVLTGCLFTGGLLLFLFSVPPSWPLQARLFALLGGLIGLNSAWALAAVPYSALVGEVRGGLAEQRVLIGWRSAFGQLGAVVGIGLAGFYLGHEQVSMLNSMAWVLTIGLFLLGFAASLSRSGFFPVEGHEETPVVPAALPPHRPLLPLFLFLIIGLFLQVVLAAYAGLALVFFKHGLNLSEGEIQNLLFINVGAHLASIPLWLRASRRGKIQICLLVGVGGLALLQLMSLFITRSPGPLGLWMLLTGAGLGSGVLIELALTQMARPGVGPGLGLTFGLWRMTVKLAHLLAAVGSSLAVGWAGLGGFDPRLVDRSGWLFGPGLVIILVSTALLLLLQLYLSRSHPSVSV